MAKKKAKPKPKPTTKIGDADYLAQIREYNAQQKKSDTGYAQKRADKEVYYGRQEQAGTADTYKKVQENITKARKETKKEHAALVARRKPTRVAAKKKAIADIYSKKNSEGGKKVTAKEYQAAKLAGRTAARKKIKTPVYTKVVGKRTVNKLVTKGRAAVAGTAGEYQKSLMRAKDKDTKDIAEDYAARGMSYSGGLSRDTKNYNEEYSRQLAETERSKASEYRGIAEQQADTNDTIRRGREKAKQEAAYRAAQRRTGT